MSSLTLGFKNFMLGPYLLIGARILSGSSGWFEQETTTEETDGQVRLHLPRPDDPGRRHSFHPEQMEAVMGQWNACAAKVGDCMIDFGTPLDGGTRVTTAGTSPSTREVAGYTILEADDFDAAIDLARNHPHLNMPGGCEIEIHEAQAIPGM